eukprot:1276730-Rhodomonas_salina.1
MRCDQSRRTLPWNESKPRRMIVKPFYPKKLCGKSVAARAVRVRTYGNAGQSLPAAVREYKH